MIMGALAIAAGASGRVSLIFTRSPLLLVAVGAAIFLWGLSQYRRSRRAP